MPPPCGPPVPLANLREGHPPSPVVAIVLGLTPPAEVTLRSGEGVLVSSLALADASAPLGLELRVWGAACIRLGYLRPLDAVHVPEVTLRRSKGGYVGLASRAPQRIVRVRLPGSLTGAGQAETLACRCEEGEVAERLAKWTGETHAALKGVPLRAAGENVSAPTPRPPAPNGVRPSVDVSAARGDRPVERTVPARVTAVRIRAPSAASLADSLAAAVADVCGACGEPGKCGCACVPRVRTLRAAIRVELAPEAAGASALVAHCAGADLARLLLSTPDGIVADGGKGAGRVLKAIAEDQSVVEAVLVEGDGGVTTLKGLRF